jgi:hypothetical protein
MANRTTKPSKGFRFAVRQARRVGALPPPSVTQRDLVAGAKRAIQSDGTDHDHKTMLVEVYGLRETRWSKRAAA